MTLADLLATPQAAKTAPLGMVVRAEAPDYSSRYNTALSPDEEAAYQAWAAQIGHSGDVFDYDLRGAWKANAKQAANGHLPDRFKKPNHSTFSTGSQYSTAETPGGEWVPTGKTLDNGQPEYVFFATRQNQENLGTAGLRDYFANRERGNILLQDLAYSLPAGGRK